MMYRMAAIALAAFFVGSSLLFAQGMMIELEPEPLPETALPQPPVASPILRVTTGAGAMLRGIDRISGDVVDFELVQGQTKQLGRIQVSLAECRYPSETPNSDAFASLVIRDAGVQAPVFQGWMIASSPALNALDHPRYDVWVLRCTTS